MSQKKPKGPSLEEGEARKKMKVGNKREQGGGIRTTLPKRDRGVHVTASLMRVKLLLG